MGDNEQCLRYDGITWKWTGLGCDGTMFVRLTDRETDWQFGLSVVVLACGYQSILNSILADNERPKRAVHIQTHLNSLIPYHTSEGIQMIPVATDPYRIALALSPGCVPGITRFFVVPRSFISTNNNLYCIMYATLHRYITIYNVVGSFSLLFDPPTLLYLFYCTFILRTCTDSLQHWTFMSSNDCMFVVHLTQQRTWT